MSKRDYPRLSIEEFGAHLLETGDLDPVYIALHKMDLGYGHMARWLIAYWCLYHCGAASFISEFKGETFWVKLMDAARNDQLAPTGERWPRGHERRHFRGKQAMNAVGHLRLRYTERPEKMVSFVAHKGTRLTENQAIPFKEVAERAQSHVLFGPWIAFKIADMIDRVLEIPVNFDEAAVFMFKDPRKAAFMLFRQRLKIPERYKIKDEHEAIHTAVEYLTEHFKSYQAPPLNDRPVGLQEVETILCKWKSHRNGHYPLFNDIDDIRGGLEPWISFSDTAAAFKEAMPKGG